MPVGRSSGAAEGCSGVRRRKCAAAVGSAGRRPGVRRRGRGSRWWRLPCWLPLRKSFAGVEEELELGGANGISRGRAGGGTLELEGIGQFSPIPDIFLKPFPFHLLTVNLRLGHEIRAMACLCVHRVLRISLQFQGHRMVRAPYKAVRLLALVLSQQVFIFNFLLH